MNINSKVVYVKKKEDFTPLISTIPTNLNPIVFIEDTKEIWTCGTYFNIGYPSLTLSDSGGSILISLGDANLTLSTSGESLSLRRGEGNSIILNSSALTKIDTTSPLKWTTEDKLIHETSGAEAGQYGPTNNVTNASIIQVPNVTVNATGHVTSIKNTNVQIRDYVGQLAPSEISGDKNVLVSYNGVNASDDTAPTRKANGLTYNDTTGVLAVKGGINTGGPVNVNNGDLTITNGYIVGKLKGDVEGQAIPKVHLSTKPEYGGASKTLYGHVIVQDDVPGIEPSPSSSNTDINNTGVVAVAASPLMVYNAIQKMQTYVNENGIKVTTTDKSNTKQDISKEFNFSDDFELKDKSIYISWDEV